MHIKTYILKSVFLKMLLSKCVTTFVLDVFRWNDYLKIEEGFQAINFTHTHTNAYNVFFFFISDLPCVGFEPIFIL